jgi:hypothetical protein
MIFHQLSDVITHPISPGNVDAHHCFTHLDGRAGTYLGRITWSLMQSWPQPKPFLKLGFGGGIEVSMCTSGYLSLSKSI